MRVFVLSIMVASTTVAAAQSRRTLAAEIESMHWSTSSGALVALNAAKVTAPANRQGLAAFQRKLVKVGSLSVIAPLKMVTIDDSFRRSPNLYDGLPVEAKLLYILSTLNADQMRQATTRGIGAKDLTGDARAAFESLVPKPFKWNSYQVDEYGSTGKQLGKGTLSDDDRSAIRIKVTKRLRFQLALRDEPRSYTEHMTDEQYGAKGDVVYVREDSDDFDRGDFFGVEVRKTQDNRPKTSDLDYASPDWNASISFGKSPTVGSLVQQIGSATGRQIFVDLRVADLPATVVGSSARAGDVLQALALAVTGTYRKVGPAYVLTSDLTGLGARKLRFAFWTEALQQDTDKREQEWRQMMGRARTVQKIGFDATDRYSPSDTLKSWLDTHDQSYSPDAKLSASDVTPELRSFLANIAHQYPTQPLKTDQFGLRSEIGFQYILPNGKPTHVEHASLGELWQYYPLPDNRRPTPESKAPLALPPQNEHALILKPTTPEALRTGLRGGIEAGFHQFWIETRNRALLEQAIAETKKLQATVRLALRPWQLPASETNDPDRNVLGQTAAEANIEFTRRLADSNRPSGMGPIPPLNETISPWDPTLEDRWQSYASLAATPGLAGAVVLETEPPGYEPIRTEAIYGTLTSALDEMRFFGYSAAARLAFLRQKSIDPIDIVERKLHTGPDLRQPFFLDDALRGGFSVYDGRNMPNPAMETIQADWIKFKNGANVAATQRLMSMLGKAGTSSIDLAPRRTLMNYPPDQFTSVIEWTPGEQLFAYEPNKGGGVLGGHRGRLVLPLYDPSTEYAANYSHMVNYILTQGKAPVAIDTSRVPANKLSAFLAYWFKRARE